MLWRQIIRLLQILLILAWGIGPSDRFLWQLQEVSADNLVTEGEAIATAPRLVRLGGEERQVPPQENPHLVPSFPSASSSYLKPSFIYFRFAPGISPLLC